MKYIVLILTSLFLITSCVNDPLRKEHTNNYNFEVEFLFEYDGIKVYRFYDCGHYHWFTSKNECINTQKKPKRRSYDDVIREEI